MDKELIKTYRLFLKDSYPLKNYLSLDMLLRIDGQDEFTIYLASVGKKL
ncbi:MAG: hypothetical protein NTZ24_09220 [Deltaproteobacteria bacterium]|nr:hypothetical protein [Deltaproteobacteria bacterium]